MRQTSFPTRVALPAPFIHGYLTAPGERPEDASTLLSPSGAWASGAIVSTPRDLNAFIRADLGLRFFSRAQQRQQMRFVNCGESSPPGPGRNSAGLALFRYQTRCGTVYGHTGNFPGYVQWAAASADGIKADSLLEEWKATAPTRPADTGGRAEPDSATTAGLDGPLAAGGVDAHPLDEPLVVLPPEGDLHHRRRGAKAAGIDEVANLAAENL